MLNLTCSSGRWGGCHWLGGYGYRQHWQPSWLMALNGNQTIHVIYAAVFYCTSKCWRALTDNSKDQHHKRARGHSWNLSVNAFCSSDLRHAWPVCPWYISDCCKLICKGVTHHDAIKKCLLFTNTLGQQISYWTKKFMKWNINIGLDVEEWNVKTVAVLTSKMMPFSIVWESIPTFNSSKPNLSNLSGVSLLRILQQQNQHRYMLLPKPQQQKSSKERVLQAEHMHNCFNAIIQVQLCCPNWKILLEQSFAAHMLLPVATSAYKLGRRC